MDKRNLTIKDIARLAGISHSTVSRVLSNADYPVSDELRERVLAIAREHNYTPNIYGRLLRQSAVSEVGVIVPNYANTYYTTIIAELEARLQDSGVTLIIMSTRNSPDYERRVIGHMLSRRVCALLSLEELRDEESLNMISSKGALLISLVQQSRQHDGMSSINLDAPYSAKTVVDYLYGLGHRNIGFVRTNSFAASAYHTGIRRAAEQYGLSIYTNEDQISLDQWRIPKYRFEFGRDAALQMLEKRKDLTAIVTPNDISAIGALVGLQQAGIRVPDDVSVVGRDDTPMAQMTRPTLTTVCEPCDQIAREIAAILLEQAETGKITGGREIVVHSRLITRGSTGPAAKQSGAAGKKGV